jgi:hypothetical protein
MKNLLFLLFCLSANAVRAQTYDYEFTAIVPLDKLEVERNDRTYQDSLIRMHTIKFVNEDLENVLYNDFFHAISNNLMAQNILGFYDEKTEYRISISSHNSTPIQFIHYDTIQLSMDTTLPSYEQITTERHRFQEDNMIGYALQHKITYNAENHEFKVKIQSIAPVERIKGYKTGYYNRPLFWTDLNNNNPISSFNIRDTNIVWAKRATISMPDSVMRTPSNQSDFSKILLKDAKKNAFTTYSYLDWLNTPLLEDELHRILFPTQNDSLAFQEKTIKRLRFKLLYYYDEKNIQLGCKIERIGIEQDMKSNKGKFEHRSAVFYIKPEN